MARDFLLRIRAVSESADPLIPGRPTKRRRSAWALPRPDDRGGRAYASLTARLEHIVDRTHDAMRRAHDDLARDASKTRPAPATTSAPAAQPAMPAGETRATTDVGGAGSELTLAG